MRRSIRFAWLAALALVVARPADAFLFVSGSNGRSGDLVAVWVKNNFELIVNLGPVEQLNFGTVIGFTVPNQFGGSLAGGKFTALAVPNPDAVFPDIEGLPGPPQNNVAFTTNQDPMILDDDQVALKIGDAQSHLDTPTGGQAWLALLNSIPAAGSQDVVSNDDDQALIGASLATSYTSLVGFTTDTIANSFPLTTAVTIDKDGTGAPYAIDLYEAFQTLTDVGGGNYQYGAEVTALGSFHGDSGGTGYAILSLEPAPEPASVAIGATALATLVGVARRRRRAIA